MCMFWGFPLGATMSVILDLPYLYSAWVSSAVAIIYTLLGGLYSVAYTDIIQLTLVFISLVSYSTNISYIRTIQAGIVASWFPNFIRYTLSKLGSIPSWYKKQKSDNF